MATAHSILVLGATGATGRQLVTQALERGHRVTAVARHPAQLDLSHPNLTTLAADLAVDEQALGRALAGNDVVLSTLGRGQSLRAHGLMAAATPRIVLAMEQAGVRRLLYLSAFGVGGTAPDAPFPFRVMFRLILGDIYADKARGEAMLAQSPLDWTILAPVLLTNGARTGRYRTADDLQVRGLARVSRADVADCMLRLIDDQASYRKRYVIAS